MHEERFFILKEFQKCHNFFVRKQTGKVKKLKKCLLDLLRGWWKWIRMQCDNNTCNIPIPLRFLSSDCTCNWFLFTQPSVCPHYKRVLAWDVKTLPNLANHLFCTISVESILWPFVYVTVCVVCKQRNSGAVVPFVNVELTNSPVTVSFVYLNEHFKNDNTTS